MTSSVSLGIGALVQNVALAVQNTVDVTEVGAPSVTGGSGEIQLDISGDHEMEAFVIVQSGANTVEPAEVPEPKIDDDEMLVRVQAVGVGIHDSYFLPSDGRHPYPIGIEAAGVIEEIGSAVSGHRSGDRIAFVSSMQPKGGTWADFVAVQAASLIIPIPDGMDFVEAAAAPVAGNAILNGTCGGAVRWISVHCRRFWGNWHTRHPDCPQAGMAHRRLGFESQPRLHALTRRRKSCRLPQPELDQTNPSMDALAPERGVQVGGVPYQADIRDELVQLMSDIAEGEIRLELEQVYPFEEALNALSKVQTRHARGKLVLCLK